jgi:hypothetical protein
MSTASARRVVLPPGEILPLVNGDQLTQPEFHSRYELYPEDEKWELVGGIVYMASPLGLPHSDYNDEISFPLGMYRRSTPGIQVLHNAAAILGMESEPQPDLGLRIRPEFGGSRAPRVGKSKGLLNW